MRDRAPESHPKAPKHGEEPQLKHWKSCFRSDLFADQVALVTGGGTGIGLAISIELASLGATVVIASRDAEKCEKVTRDYKFGDSGGRLIAAPSTNIRKPEDVERLIEWIIENYKGLDMVVNNAGGQFVSPAEDISARGFAAVLETNLLGTFLVCREAYNQIMEERGGSIVNITLGNRNGMPLMSHSGASRAGVENLTATLSTEWIESKIRINCVRPGIIWTESGFKNYGEAGEEFAAKLLPSLPAKRFGSPQEVSSAVVWLLSEGASYVSGAVLAVDGASAYTLLPLRDTEDTAHLPVYGDLPGKAKL